jgi:hypothetical protein
VFATYAVEFVTLMEKNDFEGLTRLVRNVRVILEAEPEFLAWMRSEQRIILERMKRAGVTQ